MENDFQPLTKGEDEVMRILWRLDKAFVNDIIAEMPEPKPKYTTIATFIKILENKGFVGHTAYGKSHEYYPVIYKEEYAKNVMSSMLTAYFDGSFSQMVACFSAREDISLEEMEQILDIMRKVKNNKS